ncbi:hypothetical protein IJI94_01075 [Candidatus Saccharibacteria bacterium]|nr:hypothetical protein [Candidatus Saccharibacteria bacterium]
MINIRQKQTKKAFTLVELSLAIAFISLLLIIMAALIMGLISIYRKGIAINSINTVGRSIIEDITNSVAESGRYNSGDPKTICENFYRGNESAISECVDDKARHFITQNFTYDKSGVGNTPRFGIFCTGSYSYIWNSGDAINDNKKVSIKYNHGAKKVLDFRLLKVKDASRNACKKFIKTDEYKLGSATGVSELDLDISPAEDPVDLIAKSDNTLALYYLYVSDPTVNNSSSNIFYSGTFVLATLEGGVNIMQAGNYCKPPGDYNSNFDYCAINKFNFATQAIGGI